MNELKTLQEETIKDFWTIPELHKSADTIDDFIVLAMQKAYTLGMMKGIELVEGVVEKEASAKHDNHEDWQYGNCDCDGVFDYSEIQHIIKKLKQELK